MAIKQLLICLLGIGWCSSCGYRTPPSPYPARSETLPAITDVRLYFRQEMLLFAWNAPIPIAGTDRAEARADSSADPVGATVSNEEAAKARGKSDKKTRVPAIRYFRISTMRPTTCAACSERELETLFIRVADGTVLNAEGEAVSPGNAPQLRMLEGNRYRLLLPSGYLTAGKLPGRYYFVVDYMTDSGEISPPSKPLRTVRPVAIPAPQVEVRVVDLRNEGDGLALQKVASEAVFDHTVRWDRMQDSHKAWVLTWRPVLETVRHMIGTDGKPQKNQVVYGLQLFYYDGSGAEIPVNREPLYEGSFAILALQETLYARHVDRFGNLSVKSKVKAGKSE